MENRKRFRTYVAALYDIISKLLIILGGTAILLWLMVDNYKTMIVYLLYVVGYSSVVIFQVRHSPPFTFGREETLVLTCSPTVQPLLHQIRPGPCHKSLRLCVGWSLCRLCPPWNPLDFNTSLH